MCFFLLEQFITIGATVQRKIEHRGVEWLYEPSQTAISTLIDLFHLFL
jgi:hypothetical protein